MSPKKRKECSRKSVQNKASTLEKQVEGNAFFWSLSVTTWLCAESFREGSCECIIQRATQQVLRHDGYSTSTAHADRQDPKKTFWPQSQPVASGCQLDRRWPTDWKYWRPKWTRTLWPDQQVHQKWRVESWGRWRHELLHLEDLLTDLLCKPDTRATTTGDPVSGCREKSLTQQPEDTYPTSLLDKQATATNLHTLYQGLKERNSHVRHDLKPFLSNTQVSDDFLLEQITKSTSEEEGRLKRLSTGVKSRPVTVSVTNSLTRLNRPKLTVSYKLIVLVSTSWLHKCPH